MFQNQSQGGGALLPDAEVAARVALVCAGFGGDPTIGAAIGEAEGAASEVVQQLRTRPGELFPLEFTRRLAQHGSPDAVARVLEHTRHHRMRLLQPAEADWPPQLGVADAVERSLAASGAPAAVGDLMFFEEGVS